METSEVSNLSSNELEDKVNEKLRGDNIGSTVFSQGFVLRTLLQFKDLNWNEDLEENLCFLWSMSNDKEVCEFLFNLEFPSVIANVINSSREERLIELLIGILANMVVADCEKSKKHIENEDFKMILCVHNCPDTHVLIQFMRFLDGVLYYTPDYAILISEDVINTTMMILSNCLNTPLIVETLKVLTSLTNIENNPWKLNTKEMYNNALKSFETVIKKKHGNYVVDFGEEETRNFILQFFHLMANLVVHPATEDNEHFLGNDTHLCIVYSTIKELGKKENLIPPMHKFNELIGYIETIFEKINKFDKHNYIVQLIDRRSIFFYLCLMFNRISTFGLSPENLECVSDFLMFVFKSADPELIARDISMSDSVTRKCIIKFVKNKSVKDNVGSCKIELILQKL